MKKFKKAASRWLGSLIVLALLFLPSVAFAADAAPQTALQTFTDQVMAILIPAFVTLIGLFATWILMKVKAKLHIDVGVKTQEAWAQLARDAALRGAEWARKKAKDVVGDRKIPGGEVMEVAANWALQMAEQQGLPTLAREKLVGLIESELFKLRREDAVSSLGEPPAGPPVPVANPEAGATSPSPAPAVLKPPTI